MILSTSFQNCVNEYEIATKRSIHLKACCTSVCLKEKSNQKKEKKKEKKKGKKEDYSFTDQIFKYWDDWLRNYLLWIDTSPKERLKLSGSPSKKQNTIAPLLAHWLKGSGMTHTQKSGH